MDASAFTYDLHLVGTIHVPDTRPERIQHLAHALADAIGKERNSLAPYFLRSEPVASLPFSRRLLYPYLYQDAVPLLGGPMTCAQMAKDIVLKLLPELRFPPRRGIETSKALNVSWVEITRGFRTAVVDAAWI